MAHDHDHDVADDDFDYQDIDIKDALGLPAVLPPIRLLPLPELAAQARTAPVARQLAALAEWVGKDGREVEEAGDLTPDGLGRRPGPGRAPGGGGAGIRHVGPDPVRRPRRGARVLRARD